MFGSLVHGDPVALSIAAALAVGVVIGIATGYFKARRIQPRGFKWLVFRNEIAFASINLFATGLILGPGTNWLKTHGFITTHHEPASWWIVAAEYVLYFFAFDTWFYWLHRWMHKGQRARSRLGKPYRPRGDRGALFTLSNSYKYSASQGRLPRQSRRSTPVAAYSGSFTSMRFY